MCVEPWFCSGARKQHSCCWNKQIWNETLTESTTVTLLCRRYQKNVFSLFILFILKMGRITVINRTFLHMHIGRNRIKSKNSTITGTLDSGYSVDSGESESVISVQLAYNGKSTLARYDIINVFSDFPHFYPFFFSHTLSPCHSLGKFKSKLSDRIIDLSISVRFSFPEKRNAYSFSVHRHTLSLWHGQVF